MLNMAELNSFFNKIPIEIKTKIFHKLDMDEKKSARLVCWCWNDIVDNGWRPLAFIPELSDSNMKYILKTQKNFNEVRVTNLSSGIPISFRRNKLTGFTKKVTFTSGISSENINKLLRYSANLHELVFCNMEHERIWTTVILNPYWSMNKLTSLELQFDKVVASQPLILEHLAAQHFPYLSKVFFTWRSKDSFEKNIFIDDLVVTYFYKAYFCIHEFMVNCASTLKSVSTNFYAIFQSEGNDFFLTDANMIEKYTKLCSELKNMPLNELEIHAFHQEGQFPWNLSTALLNSTQHQLTDIFLYNCELITATEVESILQKNKMTLKHFDIVSNYNAHLVVFDCAWLSGCHKLVSLGIDCYGNDAHIFKISQLDKVPKSISTFTLVSEWLPSQQEKLWITQNLLQLYYICFNVDRVFTSDLVIEGQNIFENDAIEHEVLNMNNNRIVFESDTSDLFSVTLFKKFLSIPSLRYLTLIHSKSFNSQEIRQYCLSHQYLNCKEKIGTHVNRLYITIS